MVSYTYLISILLLKLFRKELIYTCLWLIIIHLLCAWSPFSFKCATHVTSWLITVLCIMLFNNLICSIFKQFIDHVVQKHVVTVIVSLVEGLLLWNQTRLQWIGNKRSDNHGQVHKPRLRYLPVSM